MCSIFLYKASKLDMTRCGGGGGGDFERLAAEGVE